MQSQTRLAALMCALSLLVPTVALVPVAASAQTQAAVPITGQLTDQAGGVGISGATVSLFRGVERVAQIATQPDGSFAFPSQSPGIYRIDVSVRGYQSIRSEDIVLVAGNAENFRASLQRISTGSDVREIGRISTSAQRASVSTSTTISQAVSSNLLQNEGYIRIGDALGTLPGVNLTGLSSSVGDGLGIDIRGFGSDETQTLLDGHPLGPFGPGSRGAFDFQVSPSFAIGETRVTYGSGALGLYGTDSIGGTVDMLTINPTRTPHLTLTQGYGNQGTSLTNLQATGTINKIGYALVHAVEGSYGPWKPTQRIEGNNLGQDISTANLAANTYTTSGNYLLRNDLLKIQYAVNDKTQLLVSALDANSWSDKSGNGDNCYFDPNAQATIGASIASTPNSFGSDPTVCTNTVAVNTDQGVKCFTVAQYAAATSGLVPGGPGPWQAHRLHDYHARLTTQVGANNLISLDGFTNIYSTDYNRSLAGGQCKDNAKCSAIPGIDQNKFIGGFNTSTYRTTGFLISDDITTESNEFGLGFYTQKQDYTRVNFDNAGSFGVAPSYGILSTPGVSVSNTNFFVRDNLTLSKQVSAYANAWLKHSTATSRTTFDPRLSLVFRTSPADVVRLTGGRSDGEPSPLLTAGAPNYNQTVQNISTCSSRIGVGTVANPSLQPEQSTDFEVGYGHRFKDDSIVQVDAYTSQETNRIFGQRINLTPALAGQIPPTLLQAYFDRVGQICKLGGPATIDRLSLSTQANAANARFNGIELSGRYRFNRNLYSDYTYNVQSVVYNGLSDTLLKANPYNINGAQISGIPLHKASFGIDLSDVHGFEARLDTNFVGDGNNYNRGAFFYSNAFVSQRFGRRTTLNVGLLNVFNQASSNVYNIGGGAQRYIPENQFGSDLTPLDQAVNNGSAVTGLLPTTVTFSITQRL